MNFFKKGTYNFLSGKSPLNTGSLAQKLLLPASLYLNPTFTDSVSIKMCACMHWHKCQLERCTEESYVGIELVDVCLQILLAYLIMAYIFSFVFCY